MHSLICGSSRFQENKTTSLWRAGGDQMGWRQSSCPLLASKHDMKHILITTIAAVLLAGCSESQQSAPPVKTKSTESLAEVLPQQSNPVEAKPVEPVTEVAQPEPPIAGTEAPAISIHDATMFGNIEAVKQHLAAGTDVDAKDMNGWTPLHHAALNGQKETVEMLIGEGADVNAGDKIITPLHYAAQYGDKEIVELLIAKGANVNAKNKRGLTPLQDAAVFGQTEIAELLITNGADVNARDNVGKTPIDWAIEYDETEIADLLRKHGGKRGRR